jgi:hypothetical protein
VFGGTWIGDASNAKIARVIPLQNLAEIGVRRITAVQISGLTERLGEIGQQVRG